MDQINNRFQKLTTELKNYLEAKVELLVIGLGEKAGLWIGQAIQQVVGILVISIGFLFGLIALGFYLGELFESNAIGFLVASSPFFLIGLIFLIAKPSAISKNIQSKIMNDVLNALEEPKSVSRPLLPEAKEHEEIENG
ncbi:MAG: hypothetical protein AAFW89_01730 [Bacteroidota bacterium]